MTPTPPEGKEQTPFSPKLIVSEATVSKLGDRIAELERELWLTRRNAKTNDDVSAAVMETLHATIETLTRERDEARAETLKAEADALQEQEWRVEAQNQLAASEKDREALETAAQGLRDAAEAYIEARNTVDSTDRDSRNYQPSLRDARKAWMEYKSNLARFDALKEGK